MNPDRIVIRIADSYSATDRLSLAGGESDPNQTASYGLVWQPKTLHIFIFEDGIVASHVGLVNQTITVGGNRISVAGVGGVLTRRDCRGKGFGQMALKKAEEYVRQQKDANFGMLFCRDAVRPWYERLGWSAIKEPVWIDQPGGVIQAPLVVMTKCLSHESWPDGLIELGCLPW